MCTAFVRCTCPKCFTTADFWGGSCSPLVFLFSYDPLKNCAFQTTFIARTPYLKIRCLLHYFCEKGSWGFSGCWRDQLVNRHQFYPRKTENDAYSQKSPCVQMSYLCEFGPQRIRVAQYAPFICATTRRRAPAPKSAVSNVPLLCH